MDANIYTCINKKKPEPYLEEFKFRNGQVKPTYNLQKSYRIIKIYVSGVKILTHTQIMRYMYYCIFEFFSVKKLKCSPVAYNRETIITVKLV